MLEDVGIQVNSFFQTVNDGELSLVRAVAQVDGIAVTHGEGGVWHRVGKPGAGQSGSAGGQGTEHYIPQRDRRMHHQQGKEIEKRNEKPYCYELSDPQSVTQPS